MISKSHLEDNTYCLAPPELASPAKNHREIYPLEALHVLPLQGVSEANLFTSLYERYVRPHYPDSEDYAAFVLKSHKAGIDEIGYLTKRKIIWILWRHGNPVGFTVVTEKRGGSIKFGPSALVPAARGEKLGTALRLLVEAKYPLARKAYNTLPDYNTPALRYVLRAGYQIEAHLQDQYRPASGEYVVGKLLRRPVFALSGDLADQCTKGRLRICSGSQFSCSELALLVATLLEGHYKEIDTTFSRSLLSAMQRESKTFSAKYKKLFIAIRGVQPVGIVIATPKRGGALKCSPLVVRGIDSLCMQALIEKASGAFPEHALRKLYFHIPVQCQWMITTALRMEFIQEGILREPYIEGTDMAVFGRLS